MEKPFLQDLFYRDIARYGDCVICCDHGVDTLKISNRVQKKMLEFLIVLLYCSTPLYKSSKDAEMIMSADIIAKLPKPFCIESFVRFLLYGRSILYTERLLNQILEGADDETLAYYMIGVVNEIYQETNISLEFDGERLYFLNK